MSLHSNKQFLADVAAALGESIAVIRRRGFHLEAEPIDFDPRPCRYGVRKLVNVPDDTVDLAACGVDWDANDDHRVRCRLRRLTTRRRRPEA